jgi:hypothetical protein
MSDYSQGGGSGRTVQGTRIHVDGSFGAPAISNGSFEQPYTVIQDGIDAGAAGDLVYIAPGTYTEDLVPEDLVDMEGAQAGAVVVVGTMTITDESMVIENMNFIDDGAGAAVNFTGAAADTVRFRSCEFTSTATGDHALLCDNTNAAATVNLEGCTVTADVANANAAVSLDSGTLTTRECDIVHASNVAESVELLGTLASTFEARDTTFTGTIAHEAAVANPACTLTDCDIVVGAVSAAVIAAGNTMTFLGKNPITSTDAAQDAFDGAGTVALGSIDAVEFLSTADEIATTLTVTITGSFLHQSGVIASTAGASPQTTAVLLARVMPTAAYVVRLTWEATGGAADDVICSVDEGTLATTGFTIVATSAAAAAIAGNIHWEVELPTQ